MMKQNKRILSLLLAMICAFSFVGCGAVETAADENANIELLEPAGVALNYDVVDYRNIYNYKIYAANICPEVTEYAFTDNQIIEKIATLPGEEVKAGQDLVVGDTENIEEQIEAKEKSIQESETRYLDQREDIVERLSKYKADTEYWKEVVERSEAQKPAEESADFGAWSGNHFVYQKNYSTNLIARDKAQASLDQLDELYQLDSEHAKKELQELRRQRSVAVVASDVDGVLVSCVLSTDSVKKNESVVAVGNMDSKQIKTEYISKFDINGAAEVYAFVNGKRYEVEYIPMEDEEYKRLTQNGGRAYSTFLFAEDASGVNVGDYCVIAVVKKKRNNVLSISKSCLHKDGMVDYVYLVQGTETVYTPVKLGISDNLYAEILDGINEGDKVLAESLSTHSEETVKTTVGEVHYNYKDNGYMFYPYQVDVKNPVEYGSCYYVESLVSTYERVEKGQVLATVRVVRDDIALQRSENQLQRLQERLADYKNGFKDDPAGLQEKSVQKYISSQTKQIEELEKTIRKIKADAVVTEIKAEASGVITWALWGISPKQEQLLYSKQDLFRIADETANYIIVQDKNRVLNFGNKVQISFRNNSNQTKITDGEVALVNPSAVSNDLSNPVAGNGDYYTLISINPEALSDMASSSRGAEGWWNRNRFEITGQVRSMNNVVLVPKTAVFNSGDQYFVNVKKADGSVVPMGIIAGGSDANNFWVIDGLTEGMEVCLK